MARIDGTVLDLKERVVTINPVSTPVMGGLIFKFSVCVVVVLCTVAFCFGLR